MRQVQLQNADAELQSLAEAAERGEPVTLLRGERPVAQIIPFPQKSSAPESDAIEKEAARLKAREELLEMMRNAPDLGIQWNGRDELYGLE